MKVVFFGTPPFAATVLRYLLDNHVNVVAVITKPDRPKGRSLELIPTPVKTVALAANIPVYQPEKVSDLSFADTIADFQADLFVVVAYGEIIKKHILDMPKKGCINLHASLLPKYRGAAPIQRAIINGEKESGVTIMHMVLKMDAGDMIKKVVVPITPNMTYGELEKNLCDSGSKALLEVIDLFEKGQVPREEQDHSMMTLAPKLELEDCQINWSNNAEDIHNLVRGVNPFPGAWCLVKVKGQVKRLKVITTINRLDLSGEVGRILEKTKDTIVVATGKHALQLNLVQLEGKKAMTAGEFFRGNEDVSFLLEKNNDFNPIRS